MPNSDIFLSYASDDRERILPLVRALEETGWTVFWDHTIPAGKTWAEVLEAEITTARSVIVVWSRRSARSDWVQEEANEGKRRKVLVPVRIDPVEPPFGFRQIQAADLAGWDGSAAAPAFRGFVKDLGAVLGPRRGEVDGDVISTTSRQIMPERTDVVRKSRLAVWVAVAAVAAAVGIGVYAFWPHANPTPAAPGFSGPRQGPAAQPGAGPAERPVSPSARPKPTPSTPNTSVEEPRGGSGGTQPTPSVSPLEKQRAMARLLAKRWWEATQRQDVDALVRLSSVPFFFDNGPLERLQEVKERYTAGFAAPSPRGERRQDWVVTDVEAKTIAEWRSEGFNTARDRLLSVMPLEDGDFMIRLVLSNGTRREGTGLYTRMVGGRLMLAGFWD